MSNLNELISAANSSEMENCDSQDMSIRIKNGVAVITGHSSCLIAPRETANALERVSGVNRVIDLVNVAF